jgi:predicted GIY-YIG superfamily endonuclease
MSWFVYILKCSDGSYYVGHTEDIKKRVTVHNASKGAQYTAMRTPVALVYQESAASISFAMKRELQIKHWSRAKKEALIRSDRQLLKSLSRCRSVHTMINE